MIHENNFCVLCVTGIHKKKCKGIEMIRFKER